MPDDLLKIRRIRALHKLKEMQCDKASRGNAIASRELKRACEVSACGQNQYMRELAAYSLHQEAGKVVDTELHTERLMAILQTRKDVLIARQEEHACQERQSLTRKVLLEAHASEGAVALWKERTLAAWRLKQSARELEDIFDSQRRGSGHVHPD
ncbi:MAG: hypothetical protein Q7T36_08480 [Fluviicoccus sp.]|uniref:hypothetical protein n=1 Tax=Fluviicoccus sp. TaxID=2003552 RepID=UPI002719AC13|nr:hypothetical protein [Fluviicoccus sp.]MDO8330490.1 hypothetical protein [Fluviicoccus sp.]